MIALVIGGFFIVGLYNQGNEYPTVGQKHGDRRSH